MWWACDHDELIMGEEEKRRYLTMVGSYVFKLPWGKFLKQIVVQFLYMEYRQRKKQLRAASTMRTSSGTRFVNQTAAKTTTDLLITDDGQNGFQ